MAQRISIGFQASPPLALRVSDDELSKLQGALGGEGWHDVSAEDGSVRLSLQHVLWLRVEKDEARVGFGLGGCPPMAGGARLPRWGSGEDATR
ncbi:hypothetical protein [Conexibacter sp. SYSU D00693]|uniref:hypothetical protein n=1 Tax=Conexibacter sp. SYSU D00693 TaxID=2812560 RepID=UPI00196B4C01|nr:hypothetical protein [Conexibacter sp. SYSU D00693]